MWSLVPRDDKRYGNKDCGKIYVLTSSPARYNFTAQFVIPRNEGPHQKLDIDWHARFLSLKNLVLLNYFAEQCCGVLVWSLVARDDKVWADCLITLRIYFAELLVWSLVPWDDKRYGNTDCGKNAVKKRLRLFAPLPSHSLSSRGTREHTRNST